MKTEVIWEMGIAVHRGAVDSVELAQTSGAASVTAGTWDDYGLMENCREFVASQSEWVDLDQIQVLTFDYVVLETDD